MENGNRINSNGYKEDEQIEQHKTRSWTEIQMDVPWGIITGKWWGPVDKQPILALHGWQDNAGTFDGICPLLPYDIPIYCIDLPGHGLSSHLPKGLTYNIYMDELRLLRKILKHYGWTKMTIMGHSMGAAIAFLYAAIFPGDVEKMILFDTICPPMYTVESYIERISGRIDNSLKFENLTMEKQPSFSGTDILEVLYIGQDGNVTKDAAKMLLKRGSVAVGYNKYKFTRDIRLRSASVPCFTLEQARQYAGCIKAECLFIKSQPKANESKVKIEWERQVAEALKESSRNFIEKTVEGRHHFHLNTPELIRDDVKEFIQ